MANYISVPRDLTKVKSKIFFNLTKRQLICFSAAALVGVPLYFLLKKAGNSSVAAMGMMVVMLPFFFFAMYEKNGQPLEVFLGHFIDANFKRPKRRPYKTNNYYALLMRQAQMEKEVEKIAGFHKEPVSEKEGSGSESGAFVETGTETDSENHRKK